MNKLVIHHVTLVDQSLLSVNDLACACGVEVEWVGRLVEVGIVSASGQQPAQWRFHSVDLRRALDARCLERNFGVGLDAAALILDLTQEVRRLKAQLNVLDAWDQ
jgi:chaperone modulatory protein CbpM